jgi:hypothetical protein
VEAHDLPELIVPLTSFVRKLLSCQTGFEMIWYLVHLEIGLALAKPLDNVIAIKNWAISSWDDVPINTTGTF